MFAFKLRKMFLNLDTNFKPYDTKKEIDYTSFTFPGGEPHLIIKTDLSNCNKVTITHRIKCFNDAGKLLIAVNALKNLGIQKINLVLPYFPAARQDRVMVNGEPFTLKVYTNIINNLNLNKIVVFDTHSDVTSALLSNCIVVNNFKFIENVCTQLPKPLLIISPDGGALKKVYKLAKHLQHFDVVECSKSRNVITGEITGFKVYAEDLNNQNCLIVDDICDGGGTFIGLAQQLKAKNAGKLFLAVSHGIFSKGFETLKNSFNHIYTTNSFTDFESNKQFTQIKLSDGLLPK